ncbi:MAG: putative efflux protein [Osedax symbiont Rs2]|nr:MAG: putative efflux protein [Osedax symbiont Rs2]
MTIFMSMFIFALIGAISPGPVNIIATGTGANFGFRRALPHVFGATVAYTLIVLLAGIGLNGLLSAYPQIITTVQYLGAIFLLYMSFKIATASTQDDSADIAKRPPSFLQGALAQGLNPKAWLVSMSGVSLFVAANTPATLYLLIFCLISFIVCFIGVSSWAVIGHLIRSFLQNKRHQVLFNVAMGLLLSSTVLSIFINQ